jgi:AmmeMemoRadiSam system protein B
MLRQPAVAGQFYPSDSRELASLVRKFSKQEETSILRRARACLVPHAGYAYSGHVAGAVFGRIQFPKKIVILGVRHFPQGADAAIVSGGAWRTPLGDAPVDAQLADKLRAECPALKEDSVAHANEHSLEVQLPFLQVLVPGFSFVPIALGTIDFEALQGIGQGIGRLIRASDEEVLLLATSDLNHYEEDVTTRRKDAKAIAQLEALDARGLYEVCHRHSISMCGLGPAIAMLTALVALGRKPAETVKYATSAEVSGDYGRVVGYAGMIFS